eukprot:3849983-Amphidinium_carterae.1
MINFTTGESEKENGYPTRSSIVIFDAHPLFVDWALGSNFCSIVAPALCQSLQANEEAEHKGWCDTELATNEQTRKEKTASVERSRIKKHAR